MDNGDEHIACRKRIDESNRIQFSAILTEIIEKEREMARGNLMMRLLPIFKQRSASPIGNSATLKCLEPGQVLNVKNEPGDQNIPIDVVHSLIREVAALGLHHSCSSRPPVWVPLVNQKGPSRSKAPAINTPQILQDSQGKQKLKRLPNSVKGYLSMITMMMMILKMAPLLSKLPSLSLIRET